MDDHTFCRLLLRETRRDLAKHPDLEKSLSGMYADRSEGFGDAYFWVRKKDHTIIWNGSAHCAWEARAKAIEKFLRDRVGEEE